MHYDDSKISSDQKPAPPEGTRSKVPPTQRPREEAGADEPLCKATFSSRHLGDPQFGAFDQEKANRDSVDMRTGSSDPPRLTFCDKAKLLIDAKASRIICGASGVMLGAASYVGELLQNEYGSEFLPLLTKYGGNAQHSMNLVLIGMLFGPSLIPDSTDNKFINKFRQAYPEVLCGAISALNIIGETILPQILHPKNFGDVLDLPLPLAVTALLYVGFARVFRPPSPNDLR